MWCLCLHLPLLLSFMSQVLVYLDGTSLHVWQLAARIGYEGQSLCLWRELIRCADVFPILFSTYSVNIICVFNFSRLLFHSTPFASPAINPSLPSAVFPSSLLILYPLVLDQCKSRAFCCKGWYFWSRVTHTFMFQAPMTVTEMYIMLSDSVRHASSVLLFVWKWWRPTVALSCTMTLILQVLTHYCTWIWKTFYI